MGSIHVPRLTGRRRAGPRLGRTGRLGLVVAVVAAMTMVAGAHYAASAATDAPYGGTAAAVPGIVYAANYDTGGQGVAYNATSTNGSANGYRSDGIDLEATADTTNNTGAGAYDLGWTTAGQWFNYTVNAATAGTYTLSFRVASPYGITDALHIANSAGTNLSGSVAVPNTGGYQTWTTVTASVTLPAGVQTLRVDQDSNGWNLHYISFASTGGGGGTPPPGEAPYGGTAAAVPGTVQAENYDTGGQGVAYNVTAVNGSANSYRSDGVDLEATTDTGGGYDLGWTAAGQWFRYTVNVATAGTYTVGLRLAAPTAVTDAPADRQRGRDQPERQRHRPGHRRLPDLDDRHRQRHPAGRHPDPDRGPGQPRLEHQLPDVRDLRRLRHRRHLRRIPGRVLGQHQQHPQRLGRHRVRLPQRHQRPVPRQRGLLERQRRHRVDRPVAVLRDDLLQLVPDQLLPRLAHQLLPRLHRAELERHHDQRRHLASRRVRPATGHPPAQLRRNRHRGRGRRPGLRREQDRPVHPVRELRARGLQAARHRQRALQHPVAHRCRGLPAGRRGRQLHDLVRGLAGRHRDHAGGLRLPGRRNPRPQRRTRACARG